MVEAGLALVRDTDNASSGWFAVGTERLSLDDFEPREVEVAMTFDVGALGPMALLRPGVRVRSELSGGTRTFGAADFTWEES
ncbi:hypothetical protein [Nocardia sp. NPDC052112]|uniref:hypothetical protein n=1 Tax=Nocardia sp. NPDC052112 TaxID=3155646 RepID=UPI00343FCE3F